MCDLGLIGLFLWWVLKLFFSVSLCLSCFCFGCWGVLGDLEIWALFVGFFWLGKMSSLSRELVFLILQFLEEEKFKESVHK